MTWDLTKNWRPTRGKLWFFATTSDRSNQMSNVDSTFRSYMFASRPHPFHNEVQYFSRTNCTRTITIWIVSNALFESTSFPGYFIGSGKFWNQKWKIHQYPCSFSSHSIRGSSFLHTFYENREQLNTWQMLNYMYDSDIERYVAGISKVGSPRFYSREDKQPQFLKHRVHEYLKQAKRFHEDIKHNWAQIKLSEAHILSQE